MGAYRLSKHAQSRVQQRGLPPLIIDWLTSFGTRKNDHRGAVFCYFDKQSRKELAKNVGQEIVDRLGKLLNAYVVISVDGTVITAGHLYRRINRH